MLNKGLRTKESERIDNVLKTLLSLVFVPEKAVEIEEAVKDFALNIESLVAMSSDDLILRLDRLHFDWNQKEQFADFLIAFSKESQFDFSEKAIAIYDYVQKGSKVFSFGIFNKTVVVKSNINTK
jgi:hypothetical protein